MELTKKEMIAKRHEEEKARLARGEKQKNIIKWVVVGCAVAVIGAGIFWVIKESNKPLPGQQVADQGRGHVDQKEWEKFSYNSNPPTSGPHDVVWTNAGVYDQPQGEGHLVHSLEHGYIILSYNCTKENSNLKSQNSNMDDPIWKSESCTTLKKQLADIANKKLWKLVVVPRPQLDVPLALTAWNRIEKFQTIGPSGLTEENKSAIQRFIDAFQNRGPEQTME